MSAIGLSKWRLWVYVDDSSLYRRFEASIGGLGLRSVVSLALI